MLATLPANQRDALVLRYFYRQSEAEIAAALGCEIKTASSRIARALEKVRDQFRQRGVRVSAALLPALMEKFAVRPLSAEQLDQLLSFWKTAAPATEMGGSVAQVLWRMMLMKVKTAAVACVVALLLLAAGGIVLRQARPKPESTLVTMKVKEPVPKTEAASQAKRQRATQQQFMAAVRSLQEGNVEALSELLDEYPDLVTMRTPLARDGYFGQATLLHYTAGNPKPPQGLKNAVEIVKLLIERGAVIDVKTIPGPLQPKDPGWTTLGLAASSLEARQTGVQIELIRLLVAKGADVNADNGLPMFGALYYNEPAAARELTKLNARTDVRSAAALGDMDALRSCFNAEGMLKPEARGLSRYPSTNDGKDWPDAMWISEALVWAAMFGEKEAAEFLLTNGADIHARADNLHGATPLHYAALNGHKTLVELLLAKGAKTNVTDAKYQSTPYAWAKHGKQTGIMELLKPPADVEKMPSTKPENNADF